MATDINPDNATRVIAETRIPEDITIQSDSRSLNSTGTQNIAHFFGVLPRSIVVYYKVDNTADSNPFPHTGSCIRDKNDTYQQSCQQVIIDSPQDSSLSGSTVMNVVEFPSSDTFFATVTFDATNVILTWAGTGISPGTLSFTMTIKL